MWNGSLVIPQIKLQIIMPELGKSVVGTTDQTSLYTSTSIAPTLPRGKNIS